MTSFEWLKYLYKSPSNKTSLGTLTKKLNKDYTEITDELHSLDIVMFIVNYRDLVNRETVFSLTPLGIDEYKSRRRKRNIEYSSLGFSIFALIISIIAIFV